MMLSAKTSIANFKAEQTAPATEKALLKNFWLYKYKQKGQSMQDNHLKSLGEIPHL